MKGDIVDTGFVLASYCMGVHLESTCKFSCLAELFLLSSDVRTWM